MARRLGKKTYAVDRNSEIAMRHSELYQKSTLDDFFLEKEKTPYGKTEAVDHHNDVYLLFHQQRLDRMTLSALTEYVSQFRKVDSPLSSLKNKMSDSELAMFIKSRYIQSQSELLAYSQFLEDNYQDIIDSLQVDSLASTDPAPTDPAPANE